jgi:hypothetical protein
MVLRTSGARRRSVPSLTYGFDRVSVSASLRDRLGGCKRAAASSCVLARFKVALALWVLVLAACVGPRWCPW